MPSSTPVGTHWYKPYPLACRVLFGAFAIFCLSLTEGASHCWAQQTEEVERHFLAAHRYQDEGELTNAIAEYRAVLSVDPSLPEAHVNLGLLYFASNQYQKSERELLEADKLRPNIAGVSLWLGVDRLKEGDPKNAVIYLKRAIRLNPYDREARRWLGTALWQNGETESALDRIRQNVDNDPSDPDNLFVLGETYQRLTNQEIAAIMTKAALNSALVNVVYGDIYRDRQEWPKAIGHYILAIHEDPNCRDAHLGLGTIYLLQGQLDKAEKEFNAELAIKQPSPAAYSGLIIIALERADIASSMRLCENALQVIPARELFGSDAPISYLSHEAPDNEQRNVSLQKIIAELHDYKSTPCVTVVQVHMELLLGEPLSIAQSTAIRRMESQAHLPAASYDRAAQYFEQNNLGNAQQVLRGMLRIHPEDVRAHYLLARVYHALCLRVMDQLLSEFPNSFRVHQLKAEIYEDREENDEALKEYKIVEQMDDKLPGLHEAMGRLFWKTAKTDEAISEFIKELQLNPDDLLTNAEMGTILTDRMETERAIPYLKKALQSGSEFEVVHKELGLAYFQKREYVKAELELKQAIGHDPYGSANYLLGRVYAAEGRLNLAKEQFTVAKAIMNSRIQTSNASLRPAAVLQ